MGQIKSNGKVSGYHEYTQTMRHLFFYHTPYAQHCMAKCQLWQKHAAALWVAQSTEVRQQWLNMAAKVRKILGKSMHSEKCKAILLKLIPSGTSKKCTDITCY